jgi:hypothetical protein
MRSTVGPIFFMARSFFEPMILVRMTLSIGRGSSLGSAERARSPSRGRASIAVGGWLRRRR